MQRPQRLLQIGTLVLFSTMIGGLTLFQSGTFQPEQPLVEPDSLAPPTWLDSASFQSMLLYVRQLRSERDRWMSSSKSGRVFDKKDADTVRVTKRRIAGFMEFSHSDTLRAMELLRMRYEVASSYPFDSLRFKGKLQEVKKQGGQRIWSLYLPAPTNDSIVAWEQLRYSPERVPQLPTPDQHRFRVILDSLLRPRMMSSKSGLVFPQPIDTTEALKILAAEKLPK